MGLIGDWLNSKNIDDPVRGTAHVVSISAPSREASSFNCDMSLTVAPEGMEPYAMRYSCFVSAKKYPGPGATLPVTVDRHNPDRLRIEWDEVQTGAESGMEAAEQMAEMLKARRAGTGPAGLVGGADATIVSGDAGQVVEVPAGVDPAAYVAQMFPGAQGEQMAEQVRQALAMAQGLQGGAGSPAMPGMPASGAVPPVPGTAPATDPVAQIEKLAKLHEAGVLTDEEFAAKKADLLGDV